jgi:hypothetical protein
MTYWTALAIREPLHYAFLVKFVNTFQRGDLIVNYIIFLTDRTSIVLLILKFLLEFEWHHILNLRLIVAFLNSFIKFSEVFVNLLIWHFVYIHQKFFLVVLNSIILSNYIKKGIYLLAGNIPWLLRKVIPYPYDARLDGLFLIWNMLH